MTEPETAENETEEGARSSFDFQTFLGKLPIHPFAFALIPIVTSLYEVKNVALIEEIIPPIIVFETVALILLVVSSLSLRSVVRGSIITSLTIGFFFVYRLFAAAIDALAVAVSGQPFPTSVTLIIYAFLVLAGLASSLKTKWNFGKHQFTLDQIRLSMALNVVSVGILLLNSASLASYEFEDEANNQKFVNQFKTAFDNVKLDDAAQKPDIYYFIVDGFANDLTMKDMYHSDDRLFTDFLRKQNFYVVPKARSNYDRTEYSVSSTFNMQYIDAVPKTLGKNYDKLNLFCRMIQDSAMLRMLKRLGYHFVNVSSGNSATDWIYTADKNIRKIPFNHFMTAVWLLTPLYATEKYFPLTRDLLLSMRMAPGDCIKEAVDSPGPKFVLIHTEIAHAPCLLDEHGNRLPLPEGRYMINWGTPEQLAGQRKYAEKLLVGWISQLMQLTDRKAIVVIQSDHGPGIGEPVFERWCNERMRILNALYLPGKANLGCYPTMTPINNLRVVFNDYFGAKLPMVADDSYIAPDYAKGFEWVEAKDKVKWPANSTP